MISKLQLLWEKIKFINSIIFQSLQFDFEDLSQKTNRPPQLESYIFLLTAQTLS